MKCPGGCGAVVPIEGARCARCWAGRRRWRCSECKTSRIASSPMVALAELWEHNLTEHPLRVLRAAS